MLEKRNVRKSVMAHVRQRFQTPPAGSGLSALTVYGETDLRLVMQKALDPVVNRVFLLDSFRRPAEPELPMVIVEIERDLEMPFEIGNRAGGRYDIVLHVIARTSGERDDLSSFLRKQIGATVPIYDYTTGTGVLIESAVVEPVIVVESATLNARWDILRTEGSLDYWDMVRLTLRTIN